MQFSQYTQQIVWIWLKAAQMNATESTNTINNQQASKSWFAPDWNSYNDIE